MSKFFLAQWESPVALDWTLEVQKNLTEFGLSTDLEDIKKMSKNALKNLVKNHLIILYYLINQSLKGSP